jgi:WD40 repeat protein
MALWKGPVAQTLFTDRNQISELKVSPDDRWLVAAYSDGPVRLWRIGSINPILLQGHYGPVQNVTFSPDARWLFTGGSDGTVRRWNLGAPDPSNEEIRYHRRSRGTLVGVSRDLRWGVFALKGEAELCGLASGGRCEKLNVAELPEVRFSPDGRWLVTGNGGPPSKRWFNLRDLKNGSGERLDNVSAVDVGSCADGEWLASGRPNGSVLIERLGRGRVVEIPPTRKPQERVDRVLVSPDRRFVAIAWDRGTFQVWRLPGEGRRENAKDIEITYRISEMSFSPDNQWLVVADSGNAAYAWNLRGLGAEPREIRIERRITELAFGLPNQLILGSENGAATAYLLGTEKEKRAFAGHRGEITSLTFNSDHRFLATAAVDGTVRVWDLKDEDVEPAMIPYPSRGAIVKTVFSQDGRSLQTVSLDGTIRRWDLTEEGLRRTAKLVVGRNLSENEWCESFEPSPLLPGIGYHATFDGLPLLWTKGSNCDVNKKRTGA